jgi:NADPH2:quinone reductase
MIAALAGQLTEIDLKNIYVRNVRIIGSTLRSRTPEYKANLIAQLVQHVWPKVEAGELKNEIYRIFPIQQADEAQALMASGAHNGKIVLCVKE